MTIAIKTLLRLRRPCTATGMGFVANVRKRRIALAGCRDRAAIANNDAITMRCANLDAAIGGARERLHDRPVG